MTGELDMLEGRGGRVVAPIHGSQCTERRTSGREEVDAWHLAEDALCPPKKRGGTWRRSGIEEALGVAEDSL